MRPSHFPGQFRPGRAPPTHDDGSAGDRGAVVGEAGSGGSALDVELLHGGTGPDLDRIDLLDAIDRLQVEAGRALDVTTDAFDRMVGEVIRGDGYSLDVALVTAGPGGVDERFTGEDPDRATRARAARDGVEAPSCAAVATAPPEPGLPGRRRADPGRPRARRSHGFDRDTDGVGCEG